MRTRALNIGTWSLVIGLCLFGSLAVAAEKLPAGPKGGRILEKTSPKAEFFVEKDRAVTITFYDNNLKPVPVADQQVTVIAGKEKLAFQKKGDVLASTTKLPEGDPYHLAVQYREKPDARPQNFRFKLDLSTCGECKRAEYACACHE